MRILEHPNPALAVRAMEVDPTADETLSSLVAEMARAMYAAPGLGLAAPQIGVQKRVIVYDVEDALVALCNPVITARSDETECMEEGCLSIGGVSVDVERALTLTCEALDIRGEPVRIEATGLLSRVIQHEIDHLDGVLILDRCDPGNRKEALQRFRELRTEAR